MHKLNSPFLKIPFLTLAAFLALATGFIAEHFFKLRPCSLCLFQQYFFMAIFVVGCAQLFFPFLKAASQKITLLLAILYLVNAGIASYQVAVEHRWVSPPSQCQHKKLSGNSIEEMREQLLNTEIVRCDQVQWSFLGISMAGYNALYCLFWGLVAFCLSRKLKMEKAPS